MTLKRLHINNHYIPLEVLAIPEFAISALFNEDNYNQYELNKEDIAAIEQFKKEYMVWNTITDANNYSEPYFEPYHAFRKYGILAANCIDVYCIDRKYAYKLHN